ncbi:2,3,4,5-tetrahydropyridine-2,6-dicarboxylate N-succinyltransferase [Candidatus Jidaibacter acanthamoeba]|uniref:2,3,4,5-tetrahydropyridine-2,6-dicarboxylate N-succinyltransferase n=1 Tax=Candidatus Jidaibacter acanthamoebae TaxID=86105 RepID=A0A0C1MTS6_9RICK|nr:2,3,4,5-tetrahydropyridine-2,6-dicarboxylate N-succinyltransferase [Candidatus Jidaibacter acanthamoeba]KIE05487.1 2,3,4,5-tetrahydropyridine-2,6-dicarboxylate N-succinyltransferase [Candidatus Jidaibacter acanthamoeba]
MVNIIDFIESAWEKRNSTSDATKILEIKVKIFQVLQQLDKGEIRVAEKKEGVWQVNEWVKKAILLSFKYNHNRIISDESDFKYYDKVPLKFADYTEDDFKNSGFRVVPGCIVRHGAYIAENVILMPSFVNFGAYIDKSTLIDTWATVGSCAQIGKNCHISGGAGIGGVLEPLQANPVIIEDNVFIGARSEIAEGVIVEQGAVISMGVYIGSSTRIYDREKNEVIYGRIPAYSVVVPGTLPSSDGKTNTYAAIIVKKVDEKTRSKTSLNELLRP